MLRALHATLLDIVCKLPISHAHYAPRSYVPPEFESDLRQLPDPEEAVTIRDETMDDMLSEEQQDKVDEHYVELCGQGRPHKHLDEQQFGAGSGSACSNFRGPRNSVPDSCGRCAVPVVLPSIRL